MIADSGIWYLHEPFNPNKGLWSENFSYVPVGRNNEQADLIVERLLTLRLKNGPLAPILRQPRADHWLMPARLFPVRVNRLLIKDPIACLMSEYLTRKFNLQTLVLFRHPAGFVSSLKTLGWRVHEEVRKFLASKDLMKDWLGPYESLMRGCSEGDNVRAAAVLHGCIYEVLWGFVKRCDGMRGLIFEDFCGAPIEKFEELFRVLGLPYDEEIRRQHASFCLDEETGRDDYCAHEVKRNSLDMAWRWRRLLNRSEIDTVREVWREFQVPLYRTDQEWLPEEVPVLEQ
jgi:hypothetical protein